MFRWTGGTKARADLHAFQAAKKMEDGNESVALRSSISHYNSAPSSLPTLSRTTTPSSSITVRCPFRFESKSSFTSSHCLGEDSTVAKTNRKTCRVVSEKEEMTHMNHKVRREEDGERAASLSSSFPSPRNKVERDPAMEMREEGEPTAFTATTDKTEMEKEKEEGSRTYTVGPLSKCAISPSPSPRCSLFSSTFSMSEAVRDPLLNGDGLRSPETTSSTTHDFDACDMETTKKDLCRTDETKALAATLSSEANGNTHTPPNTVSSFSSPPPPSSALLEEAKETGKHDKVDSGAAGECHHHEDEPQKWDSQKKRGGKEEDEDVPAMTVETKAVVKGYAITDPSTRGPHPIPSSTLPLPLSCSSEVVHSSSFTNSLFLGSHFMETTTEESRTVETTHPAMEHVLHHSISPRTSSFLFLPSSRRLHQEVAKERGPPHTSVPCCGSSPSFTTSSTAALCVPDCLALHRGIHLAQLVDAAVAKDTEEKQKQIQKEEKVKQRKKYAKGTAAAIERERAQEHWLREKREVQKAQRVQRRKKRMDHARGWIPVGWQRRSGDGITSEREQERPFSKGGEKKLEDDRYDGCFPFSSSCERDGRQEAGVRMRYPTSPIWTPTPVPPFSSWPFSLCMPSYTYPFVSLFPRAAATVSLGDLFSSPPWWSPFSSPNDEAEKKEQKKPWEWVEGDLTAVEDPSLPRRGREGKRSCSVPLPRPPASLSFPSPWLATSLVSPPSHSPALFPFLVAPSHHLFHVQAEESRVEECHSEHDEEPTIKPIVMECKEEGEGIEEEKEDALLSSLALEGKEDEGGHVMGVLSPSSLSSSRESRSVSTSSSLPLPLFPSSGSPHHEQEEEDRPHSQPDDFAPCSSFLLLPSSSSPSLSSPFSFSFASSQWHPQRYETQKAAVEGRREEEGIEECTSETNQNRKCGARAAPFFFPMDVDSANDEVFYHTQRSSRNDPTCATYPLTPHPSWTFPAYPHEHRPSFPPYVTAITPWSDITPIATTVRPCPPPPPAFLCSALSSYGGERRDGYEDITTETYRHEGRPCDGQHWRNGGRWSTMAGLLRTVVPSPPSRHAFPARWRSTRIGKERPHPFTREEGERWTEGGGGTAFPSFSLQEVQEEEGSARATPFFVPCVRRSSSIWTPRNHEQVWQTAAPSPASFATFGALPNGSALPAYGYAGRWTDGVPLAWSCPRTSTTMRTEPLWDASPLHSNEEGKRKRVENEEEEEMIWNTTAKQRGEEAKTHGTSIGSSSPFLHSYAPFPSFPSYAYDRCTGDDSTVLPPLSPLFPKPVSTSRPLSPFPTPDELLPAYRWQQTSPSSTPPPSSSVSTFIPHRFPSEKDQKRWYHDGNGRYSEENAFPLRGPLDGPFWWNEDSRKSGEEGGPPPRLSNPFVAFQERCGKTRP